MRTALIAGGAGFIGSHLAERLVHDGWRVRVLDNLSSGSRDNLRGIASEVELVEGDVRDLNLCQELCRGVDTVFQMAAIASVASSVADPVTSHSVDLGGTVNLLSAARDQNVRRFIFSSSASVYGNAQCVPTPEDQALCPQSPYATAKMAGEQFCRNFLELYGLETVILRYFNVFGPGQSPDSAYAAAIPRFVQAALGQGSLIVYGDGEQTRDFIYVGSVVEANVLAATSQQAVGGTFNIGCGEGISILRLLAELERITGRRLHPEFRPARAGEVRHSCADITLARNVLGYEPVGALQAGLRETVQCAADPSRSALPVQVS